MNLFRAIILGAPDNKSKFYMFWGWASFDAIIKRIRLDKAAFIKTANCGFNAKLLFK